MLAVTELLIPEKANVYYAISTAHDLNFILREKGEDLSAVGGNVSAEVANTSSSTLSLSAASTPGSRHHRGHRDASKGRRRLLGIAL